MFKALSHPARVRIVEKLNGRTWCVTRLADALGLDKSAVSKHLSILKEAGIVADTRMGTKAHFTLIAPEIIALSARAESAVLANRKRRLGMGLQRRRAEVQRAGSST